MFSRSRTNISTLLAVRTLNRDLLSPIARISIAAALPLVNKGDRHEFNVSGSPRELHTNGSRACLQSHQRLSASSSGLHTRMMSSQGPPTATEKNVPLHQGQNHTNRLIHAKSPYLLQHAENPVDWYEWGTEAFEKARNEAKPIFLSVGYSACHWCHVLAHESFEDPITAKLINEHYVNVKVDREERPDVDRLYMTFLQASTGGGGWPMSVWLTPELEPFFAGTYFPPGKFRQVLSKLAEVWEDDPDRCRNAGKQVIKQLKESSESSPSAAHSSVAAIAVPKLAAAVYTRLARRFDEQHGGFGGAPKFPQVGGTLGFLVRYAALNMREGTSASAESPDEVLAHLDAEAEEGLEEAPQKARNMAAKALVEIWKGGIHDHVGGGVARYSVDGRWHVPHCEKMLYDQAQLLAVSVETALLFPPSDTDSSSERQTLLALARSILRYLSVLQSEEGGFCSAEDADSFPTFESKTKKEGAFYTWTAKDIKDVLGQEDSKVFAYAYGVKEDGNCESDSDAHGELKDHNVLYLAHSAEETATELGMPAEEVGVVIERSLSKLKEWREKNRPRPHLDDKAVTGWNGLMISGLAKAAEVFQGEEAASALKMAEDAAAFLRQHLYDETTGELARSWREGKGPKGQADDYAFLVQGLLDLYEASGKEKCVMWAVRLQETQDRLFYDKEGGGYFASAPDEYVLVRMKDAQDGAEPSAVSVTLSNLQRLAHFAEDKHKEYTEKAQSILTSNGQLLEAAPFALATIVSAAMARQKGYKQLILTEHPAPNPASPFLQAIRARFIPNRVLMHFDPLSPPRALASVNATVKGLVEEIERKEEDDMGKSKPNVKVCENFTCGLPITEVERLLAVLG
ncbi:uncharacterized protein LAESUDRAFT_698029 [Laetiporus sulphureus 93-53]|uniref:Spermatogenesis-associated protein 20-like TRX domain-containing protein n=1 Tax=Laetiporus sulphureus 93-53 TaxID=1314785 RepID=A0A165EY80_9APHY|nr:uncharacterized protein LAESUDRAFT_698029 [Laetiporus sulphureus 93-53]KZT07968.1 hypothetical protein LAESUDRAFT_698029 [Laetiporus sulphureus 93-53]